MENNNEQTVQKGWAGVYLTPDTPISVAVNFLNSLNQRLVAIEDNIKLDVDGTEMSLTDYYIKQAEEELAAQAKTEENK